MLDLMLRRGVRGVQTTQRVFVSRSYGIIAHPATASSSIVVTRGPLSSRAMHAGNAEAGPSRSGLNGHASRPLSKEETTGSTPPDFVAPRDRPEYHAYRLPEDSKSKDWIDDVDLDTAAALMASQRSPIRILVLYGSLRETSYSRLLAFEMARLLEVSVSHCRR